jgi:aminopeptidase N
MNNFYTATVYEKGAEVIRMIHTLIGEKRYRKAMDLYFEKFDGMAVTTDHFLWAMSEGGDIDLTQFRRWYDQNGTPELKVDESFENSTYTLALEQIIPTNIEGKKQLPYYFPLKIALYDADSGKEILQKLLVVSKEKESFIFDGLKTKPILSINRDFSAPIIIKQKKEPLSFLMKYDTNGFTRYEATQSFAIKTIENIISTSYIDEEFLESYGYLLELDIDKSYKALLLELPSISTLMQREDVIDFEPLYEAKEKLLREIASRYEDKLLELYSIDDNSVSNRALKNRVLYILSATKSPNIISLSKTQYYNSKNMTQRIVALDILENISQNEAKLALEDFYNRYKKQTLVMNKYFSILASSSRDGVLKRVIELQKDDVYDEKVPNLVRSLIGSFARNYRYFHAKDGSGYKFLAIKIINIDKINPQMASALAGAFKIYNKMNEINKKLMKEQLECVVSTHGLSKNTFEIIDKILK